jgi:TrmH family RNA methyltransferase
LPRVPHPLYAIIEGVEKPGNLGAILRTADAAGVTGVIVSAGATDIHNPNVLRASLGAFFTVPICESPPVETIAWLQHNRVQIVAATPEADILYTQTNLRNATAIVLGSEAFGLSDLFRTAANEQVHIPMRGVVDSLNLATSAALLLYEALRQRGNPSTI